MRQLQSVFLKDYTKAAFQIVKHEFEVRFFDQEVLVAHRQQFESSGRETPHRLVLDAEDLEVVEVWLEGKKLTKEAYSVMGQRFEIHEVPGSFDLVIVTRHHPEKNTELSGLYQSSGIFCTQCEAQGFRRISPTLDRPDVLATYRVRMEGDRRKQPVLLSNGNLVEEGELEGGRHFAIWEDPHPKPTYLFAMVAGDLAEIQQTYTSPKGKTIDLRIYTEKPFIEQAHFAMQALTESIAWDEERFGLSYDLDRFNVVAVSDFNMGAMENKSLNVFNTKYVMANPTTATDADYHNIRSVIGHEYFHNWTGNRITCRDWFQLSLKEGLTVFRDQEFSSDLESRGLQRINDVQVLRQNQFPEDSGPTSHPVQPQEYAAIDNFYTATVYEKGAEIIRMYHTILGEEGFQRGMKLYVERHDGQAVRIEEFAQAMSDANEVDFTGDFFAWYTTAGTPSVEFSSHYDVSSKTFTLLMKQEVEAVNPPGKLVIPVRFALIDMKGNPVAFDNGKKEQLVILREEEHEVTITDVEEPLLPVLMLGFSAPIRYSYAYTDEELVLLVGHTTDLYARLQGLQEMTLRVFRSHAAGDEKAPERSRLLGRMLHGVLHDDRLTDREKATLGSFPSLSYLFPLLASEFEMDRLFEAYKTMRGETFEELIDQWEDYDLSEQGSIPVEYTLENAGRRALYGLKLQVGSEVGLLGDRELMEALGAAQTMTESMAVLGALNEVNGTGRSVALEQFLSKHHDQPLIIDKWFSVQAREDREGAMDRIEALSEHADFVVYNPNRFRSLVSVFMHGNPMLFHAKDGRGYRFVVSQVKRIILRNPQTAAGVIKGFGRVPRHDKVRGAMVYELLSDLAQISGLSTDVLEVVEKLKGAFHECVA